MLVLTAEEMYDIDHYTKEVVGYKYLLMENAGRAVCEKVYSKVKRTDQILVFAGTGNNGGDGFVIARTLLNEAYHVTVAQVGSDEKMTEETFFHKQLFLNCGGTIVSVAEESRVRELVHDHEIVIDALLGIGCKGMLREPLAAIVSQLNASASFVISVDVPTGLPSDEGEAEFLSVQADETVIIGAPKLSVFLEDTAPYYGEWDVVSIGHPLKAFEKYTRRHAITAESFQASMPRRELHAHKGTHGRGLVIGGSDQMPGSLAMAVRASLRAGAGLLTAATTEKVIDRTAVYHPEATYITLSDTHGFISAQHLPSLEKYDAIAIGIGMGRNQETRDFFKQIIDRIDCPLVIDADGLAYLKPHLQKIRTKNEPIIMTPHPGEMAALLDMSVTDLMQAPFHYSRQFAMQHHLYVVLKGQYTIITSPAGDQAVNMTGNPGLAKGGSGDVLTGIILAMVMQNMSVFEALCNACFIHGMSADLLVKEKHSQYDLTATDVIEGLGSVFRTFLH